MPPHWLATSLRPLSSPYHPDQTHRFPRVVQRCGRPYRRPPPSTLRTLSCYCSPPVSRPPSYSGHQGPRLASTHLRSRLHHQSAPPLSPPPSALKTSPPGMRLQALLRSRSQSILSFLTEDSDANRCGREVVHHRIHLCGNIFQFGRRAATRPEGRPAIRPETFLRNALALHRPVPRRPHRGHLRRAASAERFLHGRRQRRRLENYRFR